MFDNWLQEVNRLAEHAFSINSPTLVKAIRRFKGSAFNRHKVNGQNVDFRIKWKIKVIKRFSIKIIFSDSIKYKNKYQLKYSDILVECIYYKCTVID